MDTYTCAIERLAPNGEGIYTAVIAANDDVGDGKPVSLMDLDVVTYMKNPVVLWSHNRNDTPIGRTTSIRWEGGKLVANFEFLKNDKKADAIRNAWEQDILKAASIGVHHSRDKSGKDVYRLVEWSIVVLPADSDAVRTLYNLLEETPATRATMTEAATPDKATDIEAVIDRALKKFTDDDDDKADLKTAIEEAVERSIKIHVDAANAATAAKDKAEADATKAKADEDARVVSRADLLLTVRACVSPEEAKKMDGKTDRELLLLAIGDEVKDKDKKSDDYLRACVDLISSRRNEVAANGVPMPSSADGKEQMSRPLDVTQMRRLDKQPPATTPAVN